VAFELGDRALGVRLTIKRRVAAGRVRIRSRTSSTV
jgi:hypothetical protein